MFRFGRNEAVHTVIDKELFIIITAEGGFSGDIYQKLIHLMLQSFDKTKHDIIVIGHHGAVQLAQSGISFRKYFKLPEKDLNIVMGKRNQGDSFPQEYLNQKEYHLFSALGFNEVDDTRLMIRFTDC